MSSGSAAPDHTVEDLRSFGAPEAEIERWLRESGQEDFNGTIVLPLDCRQAVDVFLDCSTQWRRLVAGDRLMAIGLDYSGVRAALAMRRVRVTPELFSDLQLMEDEALLAESER